MGVTTPQGFEAAGVWAAIKGSGKPDLTVIRSRRLASAAGVFTRNRFRAAPVEVSAARLRATGGRAAAIVATSGNANALTGEPGRRDALAVSRAAARLLGVPDRHVLVASTGAIGFRLPVDRITRGLKAAVRQLAPGPAAGLAAARGIMTTDTKPKQAAETFRVGATRYAVGGTAKGVGMVAPSMATVLVFLTTDAEVAPGPLRAALAAAVAGTFNAITVDGQMSTNDTAFVLANGAAGGRPLSGAGLAAFRTVLTRVCADLAHQLVADGEGASRLLRVTVRGARSAADAERAARAIADSALVKTMLYGRQANWGRIAQALGASGAAFDPRRVAVDVGGTPAIRWGVMVPPHFSVMTKLAEPEVEAVIDLKAGRHAASILTCDYTERYIKINAGYLS